jgi:hypothetical protein
MKMLSFSLCLLQVCGLAMTTSAETTSLLPLPPIPSEARHLAMETAKVFTHEGFKIRDDEWAFMLDKTTPQFLQLTLFAGNHYWLTVASPTAGSTLRVTLYDAQGHPVKGEAWHRDDAQPGSLAAVGIAPQLSGSYYVGVERLEQSPDLPLDCSLVMAYK